MKANLARTRFRELLRGHKCVFPASVFDPISARLAENIGFELGMLAGSVASLAILGAPDLIVITLTELAEQAKRICRASPLPLMVDGDHGYGGQLNVRRTVEELENAGVAAITIEDTLLPAPFGASGKSQLISVAEGIGKMRSALDARDDPGLVVIGRTSALKMAGMEETILRLRAYEAAGVDALFVVGASTWNELEQLRASLSLPFILGAGTGELADSAQLAALGVRICLQGNQVIVAAAEAMDMKLRELRDRVCGGKNISQTPADLMKELSRQSVYENWAKEFGR